MRYRSLILLCVSGWCLALCSLANAAERPNILLIVSDDQGWNDIGYHNPKMRTPNLDSLARQGVELDCHYVQPQCTPTRVALMTGRYPSRFGAHCCQASNAPAFPLGTQTLASMLKGQGYATGMSGKWHLGSAPAHGPNRFGFDYSHGSLAGAVGMYDHRYRAGSPFEITWHRNLKIIPGHEDGTHVTDLTAGEAVQWIEKQADDDGPWFFYVPFHAPHTPLVEKDEKWHEMNRHFESDDRRLYAAAVSHLDAAVGQMIDALQRTKQRDNTLVIFTSDNGAQVNHSGNQYPAPDPKLRNFSSNKPLRGHKTDAWEGGYRVPAFVNWPGKLAPRKVSQPMHVVDWMPTLSALAGAPRDENGEWDGMDVWPLLSGKKDPLGERTIYIVWGAQRQWESLRRGDWKIVHRKNQPWKLFHLSDDPNETKDLADDNREKVEELAQVFEQERAKDAEEN